jgi:hypothetical protein
MATENKILDESYPAHEDLSADQYHFVVLTSTGTVRRPDASGETPLGILQNAPESGQAAVVREIGRSKLVANDAIAIGKFVMPEYVGATDAGKGQDATGNEAKAVAFVLEASGAEDDLLSVMLLPPRPVGTYSLAELTMVPSAVVIGQAASTGSGVVVTGDVTLNSAGVTAIGANKVLTAMISDNQITSAKISANQVTTAKISDAQVTFAKLAFPKWGLLTTTLTSALFTQVASEATIDTGLVIPIKALVMQTFVKVTEAFLNAGQALITVGDGTDPDRYNTGAPSVSATSSNIVMGDPSGIKTHVVTKNVNVTLSCATNLANLTSGSMQVDVLYLTYE